jgi:hypothetical protein
MYILCILSSLYFAVQKGNVDVARSCWTGERRLTETPRWPEYQIFPIGISEMGTDSIKSFSTTWRKRYIVWITLRNGAIHIYNSRSGDYSGDDLSGVVRRMLFRRLFVGRLKCLR